MADQVESYQIGGVTSIEGVQFVFGNSHLRKANILICLFRCMEILIKTYLLRVDYVVMGEFLIKLIMDTYYRRCKAISLQTI